MALTFPSGFIITAPESIDNRIILTKAQMLAISQDTTGTAIPSWGQMPELYFCLCKDNKRFYIFDSSIDPEEEDPEVGCFRPIEDYFSFASEGAKANFEEALKASPSFLSIKDDLTALDLKVDTLIMDGGDVE